MDNTKLLGPVELLKSAWSLYKSRWEVFTTISLVPGLMALVFGFLFVGTVILGGIGGSIILAVLFIIVMTIVSIWGQIALLYAVKDSTEGIGFKESFTRSKGKIWSYLGIAVLSGLIIVGGFILLIIPGIIFMVWYGFGLYVLVDQGLTGMDALKKSKEYVKGRWGAVFGRVLFIGLVYAIVMIIIGLIVPGGKDSIAKDVADFIVGLVMGPISIAYSYLLYKNLKSINEAVPAVTPAPATV